MIEYHAWNEMNAVFAVMDELEALRELGLYEEARQKGKAFLEKYDSINVHLFLMGLAMTENDLQTASQHALHVHQHHPKEAKDYCLVSTVLNYAGYLEESYELAKRQAMESPDYETAYSVACRAWPLGRIEEAFRALLTSLATSGSSPWNARRKAFLDVELRSVFQYASTRSVSPADALRWAHFPLEEVIEVNRIPLPIRSVDFADLASLPNRKVEKTGASSMRICPTRKRNNGK